MKRKLCVWVLCLGLFAYGCSDDDSPSGPSSDIVGIWTDTDGFNVEYTSDGTLINADESDGVVLTWTIDGNTLTLGNQSDEINESGDMITAAISYSLVLTADTMTLTFDCDSYTVTEDMGQDADEVASYVEQWKSDCTEFSTPLVYTRKTN